VIVLTLAFAASEPGLGSCVGLFVSTLVHVSLFTGAFMLFGALKSRSTTGYLATGVLVLCSVVALLAPAEARGQVRRVRGPELPHLLDGQRLPGARARPGRWPATGGFAPFAGYRDLSPRRWAWR
jgi:hypothetical protein